MPVSESAAELEEDIKRGIPHYTLVKSMIEEKGWKCTVEEFQSICRQYCNSQTLITLKDKTSLGATSFIQVLKDLEIT